MLFTISVYKSFPNGHIILEKEKKIIELLEVLCNTVMDGIQLYNSNEY